MKTARYLIKSATIKLSLLLFIFTFFFSGIAEKIVFLLLSAGIIMDSKTNAIMLIIALLVASEIFIYNTKAKKNQKQE